MNHLTTQANVVPLITPDAGARAPELLARTRTEMLSLLQGLLKQAVPLTVILPNEKGSLDSSLIFVDEPSNMLLLTCPPAWAAALEAEVDSARVRCVYEDAKVEFPAGPCVLVDLDGAPVVGLPIPEFMWRFQRRRDPRHKVSGLSIVLNLGFLEADAEVIDLSVSGIGLIHCNLDIKLDDGEVLQNCSITLPGVGQIKVNLVVQHQRAVVLDDGSTVTRAGCKFSGLSEQSRQLIAHYLEARLDT